MMEATRGPRSRSALLGGLILALLTLPADAEIFCAASSAAITEALADAQANTVDDEIRIVAGSYAPSATFSYLTGVDQDLTLSGGWGPGCVAQRRDPRVTVLSGNGARQVMDIDVLDATAAVTVRYLSFVDGNAVAEAGGGLKLHGAAGNELHAAVESCIFSGNTAGTSGGGLDLATDVGTLRLVDSLVVGNVAATNFGGVLLTTNGSSAHILHNVVVGNTVSGVGVYGGLRIAGATPAEFANNVFWGNEGIDLKLSSNGIYFLHANDIEDQEGTSASSTGNVSVDPQFASDGSYRPVASSDLVDAGLTPVALPALDIAGGERPLGLGPDIGAYESGLLFADDFEIVTLTVWSAGVP